MKPGNQKTMKTFILVIGIITGLVSLAYSQDYTKEINKKDQIQTLFGFDSKITGYGSLDAKFTRLNDKDAVLMGAHGGVIFDSYFFFGLGAFGLVTTNQFLGSSPEASLDMRMGYTGLMMGFNIMPKKVVHFSVPMFFRRWESGTRTQ